jgi:hypothetical protein
MLISLISPLKLCASINAQFLCTLTLNHKINANHCLLLPPFLFNLNWNCFAAVVLYEEMSISGERLSFIIVHFPFPQLAFLTIHRSHLIWNNKHRNGFNNNSQSYYPMQLSGETISKEFSLQCDGMESKGLMYILIVYLLRFLHMLFFFAQKALLFDYTHSLGREWWIKY